MLKSLAMFTQQFWVVVLTLVMTFVQGVMFGGWWFWTYANLVLWTIYGVSMLVVLFMVRRVK